MSPVILLLILTMIVVIIFSYVIYFFSNMIMYPKVVPYKETLRFDVEEGKINEQEFEALEKEEFYTKSNHNYKLHGIFVPNNNSKKVVIFTHGHTWSLYGSIKYMYMFLKRGFAVVLYDNRNHGLSSGTNTSFGFYEKDDLKTIIDFTVNKLGPDTYIGIHGESMGSSISLETLAIDNRIKFCVSDCGYSDLQELLKFRMKEDYKIRFLPIVKLADKLTQLRANWNFNKVSPIKNLHNVETPILFIHGENDNYVPTFMARKMYDTKTGYKELYIAPNAGHAQAFWKNQKEYEERVDTFLKNIGAL